MRIVSQYSEVGLLGGTNNQGQMRSSERGHCDGIDALLRDTTVLSPHTSFSSHTGEGYVRTQPEGSCHLQAGKRQNQNQNPTTLVPSSLTFSLQKCQKIIKYCCLSHPVCSTFLWQSEQAKTDWKRENWQQQGTQLKRLLQCPVVKKQITEVAAGMQKSIPYERKICYFTWPQDSQELDSGILAIHP